MLFCKGSQKNILVLKELFHKYAAASGQIINPSKSTFYAGFVSTRRQSDIANLLGFAIGKLPFIYLGILILKGKPRTYICRQDYI